MSPVYILPGDTMSEPIYKICIVGEAWGAHEEEQRKPFVGPAGWELNRMLKEAGIVRHECYLTNVFNLRPKPTNKIDNLCTTRKEVTHGLPPLSSGKHIRHEYLPEIDRLYGELKSIKPNIAIALGGTAAWALLRDGRISKLRGAIAESPAIPGLKVLPTFHPSYILQGGYSDRHVTVLDLQKARREAEYPEIRRPKRIVYIEPLLEELPWFEEKFIRHARVMAVDIETRNDQITCIGFAPSAQCALVVPIEDPRKPGWSYWSSLEEELQAWQWIRRVLALPQPEKVFQNGLFDLHRLWRGFGIPVNGCEHDSMLLHHALQPEAPKGLAYLGSVYTDEAAWKMTVRHRKKESFEKEE